MATKIEAPPRPAEDEVRTALEPGNIDPAEPPRREPRPERLISLDAFRGFIMISLAANGFGLRALENHPQWGWLGRQFEHVPWEGMVFWDLIQPSFMFMVGLAMPYAFANRRKRGESAAKVTRHIFSASSCCCC